MPGERPESLHGPLQQTAREQASQTTGEQQQEHDDGECVGWMAQKEDEALYESDLDQVWILDTLKRHGFVEWRDFHDDPAKAVVVFTPSDRSSR